MQSVIDMDSPSLLVFYTHHRPHLAHRDLEFFTKARKRGWICEEILTQKFPVRKFILLYLSNLALFNPPFPLALAYVS